MVRQGGVWRLIESTEVSRARSALAAKSRLVSALLDGTTALVASIDPDGRILRCNSACEALAGRPRSEIEGRYAWDTFDVRRADVIGVLAQIWEADGRASFEAESPARDGSELVLSWTIVPVHNEAGELEYIVATGQDITAHKQAQRILEEAYEVERRVARTLQESLLRPVRSIGGVAIGVAYRAAVEAERVGGDFYDVFELSDERVAFVVGDISGKGVGAAGLTETVRSTIRALAHMGLEPAEVLTRASVILEKQTPAEQFATVGFGILEKVSGRVTYANAGHPAPVVAAGPASRLIAVPTGPPLGTYLYTYEAMTFALSDGESLVLYTDGLIEARRGQEFFDTNGLLGHVVTASPVPTELAQGLLKAADRYAHGDIRDDIAVVVLALLAADESEVPAEASA